MGAQEEIKKSSSVWVKNQDDKLRSFAWQAGYGAFSVGASQVPVLLSYIDNQWEHHHSSTFKEEFLNFLNRYGLNTMNDISGTEGGVTPFQGSGFGGLKPRALPWAGMYSPFRAKK